jgi:ArsR family transcriptional regulator, arsenate/arsenite/antimonite-responsive transcriptional repressor
VREIVDVAEALSDPGRVRIVGALLPGELCVCQIIELLTLAPSTISKHLSILRAARLIDARKQGRWMYYRIADDAPPAARGALRWLRAALEDSEQAAADARALKKICRMDPEELCCVQRARCC